jgi:4-hydroxybenzoate polyprenyltransferase
MPPLLQALRPHQWTKNLIVLVPLVFARRLTEPEAVVRAVLALVAFCLVSGAVYLLNDLRDLEQDRLHPVKRLRPLASGRLRPATARVAMAAVLLAGLALAVGLGPTLVITVERASPVDWGAPTTLEPSFLACVLAYLLLLGAYSYRLKHVVVLDVMVIAMGFVVRTVAGAAAIGVAISSWLLICAVFLALFLALSKRRHELMLLAGDAVSHRRTLGEYDPELLDQMIGVVAAGSVLSYALYTMAPETMAKFQTDRLNVTLPFVIYGLFRYLYLVHRRDDGGDPAASLLADRPLLVAVGLWGLTAVAVLYG